MTAPANPTIPGYRLDHQGRLVPEAIIPDATLLRDDLVRELIDEVQRVSHQLAALKRDLLARVAEHVALVASQYGADISGRTGDVRLDSYDGLLRIERATGRRLTISAGIHAAEELVRRWLDETGADVPAGYRAIADRTFRRSPKTGELSVSRLVDFAAVEIDHPLWRAAQKAIREAIETSGTVTYFRAYARARPEDPWTQIPIDFSSIAPAAAEAKL